MTEPGIAKREDIRRGVAVEQCCYQINSCIALIDNPRTREATRIRRIGILESELMKLQQLMPEHAEIPIIRDRLNTLKRKLAIDP